jgi:gluconolactonase
MSTRRRLALLLTVFPAALIVYACSSDSTPGGTATEEEGGGSEGGIDPIDIDSSTNPEKDSSVNNPDTSTNPDAADGAVQPACIGNPLTPDGGTPDGGLTLGAAAATQIVTVGAGAFLDGPQWIDAQGGFLVFSEFQPTESLRRVAADGGGAAPFRTAGFSAALGPIGNSVRSGLVITAVGAKNNGAVSSFFLTQSDGGAAGTLPIGAGATSPNDLAAGPMNNLYFTDGQYLNGPGGAQGLYRIQPDGGVVSLAQNIGRANGIALSPDNTKLYVGIGAKAGDAVAKGVLVYNVAANGAVTVPGTAFLTAADLVDVPDGLAVDSGGNLWVASAAAAALTGRVEVFSPLKKKLGTIPFPNHRPTGVTFGGADGKTLFITAETGVFTFVSRCAGVK